MTPEDILQAARELVPEITRRQAEIAAARKLPRDLVDKLKRAGVFRIMVPKARGGVEMPLPQQAELMEILGYADPSVSWVVKIGSDSGFWGAWLDDEAARELYPDPDCVTAGQAPPNGRALRVAGGYRVTGRWGFGSGCTHADVMVAGCHVVDERAPEGPPQFLFVLAPVSSWTIEDTWYSTGLAGSGSHHYTARDLFIPERHTFSLIEPAKVKGPLYDESTSATVFVPMVGTPLGLARRAIDTVLAMAGEKVISLPPPPTLIKDLPRARFALARAQMMWGAARAYTYETVNRLWREKVAQGRATPETRREVGLARINAFRMACAVSRLMLDTVGPSAIFQSSPLDGLFRDAFTMNQHLGFNDGVVEQLGIMLLGGEPTNAFV